MITEMGELWIYQRWTHIPEWSYAHQHYWVSLAEKFGSQIIFKKIQNSQWTHPLTKLNINKISYVDSILLWLDMYVVEEPFYFHSTLINLIIKV
jgi:hypothetical protein